MADGRAAYVEAPAVAPNGTHLLLLGTPALTWAAPDRFDLSPGVTASDTAVYLRHLASNTGFVGFLLDSTAMVTPLPAATTGVMLNAVAVRGSGDTVDILWSAAASSGANTVTPGSLWYSEFHNNHWGASQRILEADRLDWSGARPAVLVRGDDVYVLTAYADHNATGIAFVRRVAGRWHVTKTPMFGLPSEVDAAFGRGDSLVIAYVGIGAPDARVPNGSHVYIARFVAADSILPRAQRVEWSGLDTVHWPHLYWTGDRPGTEHQLVLMWARWPRGRGGADAVLSLVSGDDGHTWSPLGALTLPLTATWSVAAQDAAGDVHIITGRRSPQSHASMQVYAATLHGTSWSHDAAPSIEQAVGQVTLSFVQPDSLLLFWSEGRPSDRRDNRSARAPISRYAWSTRACPERAP